MPRELALECDHNGLAGNDRVPPAASTLMSSSVLELGSTVSLGVRREIVRAAFAGRSRSRDRRWGRTSRSCPLGGVDRAGQIARQTVVTWSRVRRATAPARPAGAHRRGNSGVRRPARAAIQLVGHGCWPTLEPRLAAANPDLQSIIRLLLVTENTTLGVAAGANRVVFLLLGNQATGGTARSEPCCQPMSRRSGRSRCTP